MGPSEAEVKEVAALAAASRHHDLETQARALLLRFPDSGWTFKVLGLALWAQGKDALPALQRAVELLPDDVEALVKWVNASRAAGQPEQALSCHRRALAIEPAYAEAHNDLGSVLQDLGHLEEALASFRRATELRPDFALAHSNLGNVLSLQHRTEDAELSCRRALELNPRLTAAIVQLAELQATHGEFATAEKLLKHAVTIEPNMPEAWAGLVRWRRMGSDDAAWLAQAQRIAEQRLPPRREIPLRYAIGKYCDDVGDYEQAFANYRHANELSKAGRPTHDRRRLTLGFARLVESFDGPWLCRARLDPDPSERAVFIIGMPRSGTTLAEQIFASHPSVFGAGELPFWNAAATAYTASNGIAENERAAARRLADDYAAMLGTVAPDAHRVVDKMPGNFLHLGLIHAALPNAKFVHLRRNPIDTCLSIYFQNFEASHSYANDLEDLAHYYGEYLRIMAHWRQILPREAILEIPYEELVADPEAWSRNMLEFIELPWDAKCLEFHRNSRAVGTFSKWQARQKISTASVERWRHYAQFIGPLRRLTGAS